MSDEIDFATEAYGEWLENTIASQRLKTDALKCLPVGTCYNCGDPVGEGLLFCDEDCRNDLEKRNRHAKINA